MYRCTSKFAHGRGKDANEAKFVITDVTGKWFRDHVGEDDEGFLKQYCSFAQAYCTGKVRETLPSELVEKAYIIVVQEALKVYKRSPETPTIYKKQKRNLAAFFKSRSAQALFQEHWTKAPARKKYEKLLESFVTEVKKRPVPQM